MELSLSYHHAPFASDILQVLKGMNKINYSFELSKPLKPIEQLILIIPLKDKNIIPKFFHEIYKIKEFYKYFYFEKYIKYDNNYVQQRFKTTIFLPKINMEKYQSEISNIIKNLEDKQKNILKKWNLKVHYLKKLIISFISRIIST